jgi:predicted ArsR family transcriptional regulator
MDKNTEKAVLAFIKSSGAVTEKILAESLRIERPAARKILAELVLEDKIVWVGQLPRAAVFFKLAKTKGYGFTLRRGEGGGRRFTDTLDKVYKYLVDEQAERETMGEIAEKIGLSRDTVRKSLHKLEEDGKVQGVMWREARRGRPSILWGLAGWASEEDVKAQTQTGRLRLTSRERPKEKKPKPDDDDNWRSVVTGL